MAITTANKFWLSLSPQSILKGNVVITVLRDLPTLNQIRDNDVPFEYAVNMTHPILPKFNDFYLMVGMRFDNLGLLESTGNYRHYDNLRKGVKSDYCNFYYDNNKYAMKLITSSHNSISDQVSMTILSSLLSSKKLYRILDISVTDFEETPNNQGTNYNIKIRYLEKI